METTYLIEAADGSQYGPATREQLQEWIAASRVGPLTKVLRSDHAAWQAAQNLPELSFSGAPAVPSLVADGSPGAPMPDAALALAAQVKSGASWFYWIAALSLFNSVMAFTGSGYGFIVGLGITQMFDGIGQEMGGAGAAIALGLDLLAAGALAVFGLFANRHQAWAFILGMVLYALDGLVFLLAGDWLGLGFHAFALFCIWGGYQALQKHRQLCETLAPAQIPTPSSP